MLKKTIRYRVCGFVGNVAYFFR